MANQPPPTSNPTRIKIKPRTTTDQQQQQQQQQQHTNQTTKLKLRVKPPQPQQDQPTPTTSQPTTQQQINQIREQGLQLWHRIVNTADVHGRLLSFHFMDLPSTIHYPDYYQIIKHPIALNPIKAKLESEQDPYDSLEQIKSDLKRVFNNAKKYNLEDSGIYKDAKILSKIVRKSSVPDHPDEQSVDQQESTEPKQKKLKLNFKLGSQTTNPTPPATLVVPPTPTNPIPSQSQPPQTGDQTIEPLPGQETQGMSQQEIARIQTELIAQTEARSKAREQQTRETESSEEERRNRLRQQAQAHQLQLRQQSSLQTLIPPQPQPSPDSQTQAPHPAQIANPSGSLHPQQSGIISASSPPSQLIPTPTSPVKVPPIKNSATQFKAWFKSILDSLESVTDRAGRKLVEEFLTLPDKIRWKSYYQIILDPIAFDNIQAKNNRQGYKDLDAFKEDVLRIFKNAQHFNEDGSMVWNDSKVLQAKFLELIRHPPPDLEDLVPPGSIEPEPEPVEEVRPVTPPPSSMNGSGKRKAPERRTPSRQAGNGSSGLVAPVATVPLRRSSRSPSHRSPSKGSPVGRLISRPVSPLPKRAGPATTSVAAIQPPPPPLAAARATNPINTSNDIIVPPQLPPSMARTPSRLTNDISPALLSLSNQHHNSATVNLASNYLQPASLTPSVRVRSMAPIPVKVSDSLPPMINGFKIISRPKTMENMKIRNKYVFQHGFKVPAGTKTVVIESELNRAWPLTRQLRSSDRHGALKVKMETIKVQGKYDGRYMPAGAGGGPGAGAKEREKEKEPGTVTVEVTLVDGMNVVEFEAQGKAADLPAHLAYPPTLPSAIPVNPPATPSGSAPNPSTRFFHESYRLFIFK